ncbi:MAG TPA: response regulator [Pyrinomonadaceae bacterium]|jgi:DNA-binding NtrC family response regulator
MKEIHEILVIDDEPSVADALMLILEDRGYRVVVAKTGREAIEHSERKEFCLTITDFRLPDMTGFDVLHAIRRRNPQHQAILITSHSTPEVFAEARDIGAITVLPKPFLPSEILQLITDALAACQSLRR